jgi:SAM-dependent methyltransferase
MRKYLLAVYLLCFSTLLALDPAEMVFTDIYDRDCWGGSGTGSQIENARGYVALVQEFLKEKGIETVTDVGCGDWQFSQYINWDQVQYTGYDVVKSVIEKNQIAFGKSWIRFVQANAINENLPQADLLLCKDVLQHLPYEDIWKLIHQLHKFKHCFITNDVNPDTLTCNNCDIKRGDYRVLDLTKPPFNLKGQKIFTYRCGGGMKQVLYIKN